VVHRMLEGVFKSMVWELDRDWSPLGFLAPCEQFLHGGCAFGYQRDILDVRFESEPHLFTVTSGEVWTGSDRLGLRFAH